MHQYKERSNMSTESYLAPDGELHAFMIELEQSGDFSGTLLVGKDDRVLFTGAYGFADRAKELPMKADTKLNIGSINKSFTSVAVCQLIGKGLLNLGETVEAFLPEFCEISKGRITIEMLLRHTSGLGDFHMASGYTKNQANVTTIAEYLPYCKDVVYAEPGERFSYSNAGYIILGAIIEKVSNMNYFDYVNEHVYMPAGMVNSGCYFKNAEIPNMAIGYIRPGLDGKLMPMQMGAPVDKTIEPVPNTSFLPPRGTSAGGGYSTVEDLFRFIRAVNNETLIKGGFKTLIPDGSPDYNYGISRMNPAAIEAVSHTGGAPGINSIYEFYQKLGYTFVIQSNLGALLPVWGALRKNLIPNNLEKMPPKLEVNGKTIPDYIPIIKHGAAYVSVEVLCEELDISCDITGDCAVISTGSGSRISLNAESDVIYVDGEPVKLSSPCLLMGGTLMLPFGPGGIGGSLGVMSTNPSGMAYGIVKLAEPPKMLRH